MDSQGGERSSAKRDRLARFYRVMRYLNDHPDGARPEEIARFVHVSRRTVYRDLLALEDGLGIPVWNDRGRWGVESSAFLPSLKLTQTEAMTIVLALRLYVRYADEYDPDLAAAFQKIAEVLPPVLRDQVSRTLDVMANRPFDEHVIGRLRTLTKALVDRRVVVVTYDRAAYHRGEPPREARVRPYLIEPSASSHGLYLIGFDETRNEVRTFKIERILGVSMLPETFERPDAETIEQEMDRAWGLITNQDEVDVVLRFHPDVARLVSEARWHPSERTEMLPDGGIRWEARVSGTTEIRLWILGWGDSVEVLAPAELREDIAATHCRAVRLYASGRDAPAVEAARHAAHDAAQLEAKQPAAPKPLSAPKRMIGRRPEPDW